MKKLIVTALLLAAAGPTLAAESTTLKVTGLLKPRGCDITLPGGNRLDFGLITTEKLNSNSTSTPFPDKDFSVDVTCAANQGISVTLIDNKAASLLSYGNDYNFGLGFADAERTKPIGAVKLQKPGGVYILGTGLRDNGSAVSNTSFFPLVSTDSGASWSTSATGAGQESASVAVLSSGIRLSGKSHYDEPNKPQRITSLSFPLRASAVINKKSEFPTGKGIYLDGSVTLVLSYY